MELLLLFVVLKKVEGVILKRRILFEELGFA
jgi:hypothetical protein